MTQSGFDPTVPDENNPETRPFWQAAREGRFLLRRCRHCARTHWYPRDVCPHCFQPGTVWEEASGRGTIHSFTIFRAAGAPEVLALIELHEGPRMLCTVLADDIEGLTIGQPVSVAFRAAPVGPPIPVFRPDSTGERLAD